MIESSYLLEYIQNEDIYFQNVYSSAENFQQSTRGQEMKFAQIFPLSRGYFASTSNV